MDDKGRSEGCILHDTNPTARQAVPKFLHRKPRLPVHVPAIRPVLCSLGIYQDPEAGSNSAQRAGSEASGIHRRHSSPGGDSGDDEDSHRSPNLSLREPGIRSTSIMQPSQEIEFLGMVVDPKARELCLLGQKIKKLRQEAAMVIRHHRAPPTAREVSRLLGKFNSVPQTIPPGPLFCRAIQRDLAMALDASKQCYDAPCHLSPAAIRSWSGGKII